MKTDAQFLYDFILNLEESDAKIKKSYQELEAKYPSVPQPMVTFHEGRESAFNIIKKMMTDHIFQAELSQKVEPSLAV